MFLYYYLRMLLPPPREELPPPDEVRIVPPPDAGIDERLPLDERTVVPLVDRVGADDVLERIVEELLLVRFTEGVVERVAVVTLDVRLVEGVVRVVVFIVLLERVVVVTEFPRTGVVLVTVARERETLSEADVLRTVEVRTLVLSKVRESPAVLRFDTRVAVPLLSIPTREVLALRIAAWRLRSISRALV